MTHRIPILLLLSAPLLRAADKVTYDDQVFPIFQQACLNCHNPDKTKGGLDLSSYAGSMKGGSGGKIAEPGDAGSVILSLVLHTAQPKMPPEGDKIPASQVEILKQWIEGGLLENKNSSAKKPSKPKFETALRSDPGKKPDGPPPVPEHVLLEPPVVTRRAAAVHAIAASPWAPLLAVTSQHQILLHDTNTLELVGILPFPEGDPVSLAFTPDARYLVVGGGVPGKSGLTVTFDVTNGQRLLSAGKEFDAVLAADIRPGFDVVATGGPSKLLKLWKTDTGEMVLSIKKHTDWITALDISNDGVLLASGDRNGGVWVWETATGSEFHTLRAHQAAISSVAFRADSNILATASEDGSIRFWEMNGGSEVKKIDAHGGGVTGFAFARNGMSVSAGRDKKLKLWKEDFAPVRELAKDLPALPTCVAIDSEGTRAFVGDALGTIRAYDTASGRQTGEIQTNPPSIEERLRALAERSKGQQEALAKAQAIVAERDSALQNAGKALDDAEKALKQSRDIHQAAKSGEDKAKQDLNALRQSLADRRGAIEHLKLEQAAAAVDLANQRQALAALPEDKRDGGPVAAAEKKAREISDRLAATEKENAEAAKSEASLVTAADAATKTAAAAASRIKPAEDALPQKRESIEAAKKASAEALAAVEALKAELPAIQAAEKRWAAAAINTRALVAGKEAALAAEEGEGELDHFSAALAALEPQTAALGAKRTQRASLLERLARNDLSPEVSAEYRSTIAALDVSIDREADALRKLEEEALSLREVLEASLPKARRTTAEANRLRGAYLQARQ